MFDSQRPHEDGSVPGRRCAADPADILDRLVRLGRLAYGGPGAPQLTPTQWTVLRYFGRANRFSRTVSAFAEFHASTRGTASQTIKGLVQRGYLTRTKSATDRRSVRLDMTERGWAALAADPCARLEAAIASLPAKDLEAFEAQLLRLTELAAAALQRPVFGTCRGGCAFLETGGAPPARAERFACRLQATELASEDLDGLCADFAPV